MTPEELQEIPGVDPQMVESIRDNLTGYYAQFEEGGAPLQSPDVLEAGEAEAPAAEPAAIEETAGPDVDPDVEDVQEAAPPAESPAIDTVGEFDTIIVSGPKTHGESEESGS
jgi:hypothetical protein